MKTLNPNGDFKVKEELHTTAVFPKAYSVSQAADELRESKACGQFVVYLVNGGIRKMEFLEREEVEVNAP
jgi:hypothetical protein